MLNIMGKYFSPHLWHICPAAQLLPWYWLKKKAFHTGESWLGQRTQSRPDKRIQIGILNCFFCRKKTIFITQTGNVALFNKTSYFLLPACAQFMELTNKETVCMEAIATQVQIERSDFSSLMVSSKQCLTQQNINIVLVFQLRRVTQTNYALSLFLF